MSDRIVAKNIAVSEDVYALLRKAKLPGESFSDVIRRSLKRGTRLSDIRGSRTISREHWVMVEKTIKASEALAQKKLQRPRAAHVITSNKSPRVVP